MGRVARRNVLLGSMLTFAAGCVAMAEPAQAQPRMRFNIPATRLDEALSAYSRQSGYRLLFPFEPAERGHVRPVVGEFTAAEALDRLLAGTELTVASRGRVVITLRVAQPPARTPAPIRDLAMPARRPADLSELVVTAAMAAAGPLALGSDPARNIASTSEIDQETVLRTPRAVANDLYRSLAGFQAVDFGQGPVANGLALRGWTAINDGQDLAVFVDGRPLNLVSGTNSNGYLDLNPVIPELISRSVVVRGPMDLRYGGNLAIGGAIITETRVRMPTGVSVSATNLGQARVLGTLAFGPGEAPGYLALDLMRLDGYRDHDDGHSANLVAKTVLPVPRGEASLSLQAYGARFGKPSYLRVAAIDGGLATKRSAIDGADFGEKFQVAAAFRYRVASKADELDLHLYADWAKIGSATSFGGRPRNVDPFFPQYIYEDVRVVLGGDIEATRALTLAGRPAALRLGLTMRADQVDSDRAPGYRGEAIRVPTPLDALYFGRASFWQLNPAIYAGLEIKPTARMRLTAGARFETFRYAGDSTRYNAATDSFAPGDLDASRRLVLFKLGAAFQLSPHLTLTASFGQSARAPSAVMDIPVNPDLKVSRLQSHEASLGYSDPDRGLTARLGVYETTLGNEVGYVSFIPTNYGRSRRRGLDFQGQAQIFEGRGARAALTVDISAVQARLLDSPRGAYVPNVASWVGGYGVSVNLPTGTPGGAWLIDLQHQRVGPQRLTPAGDVEADAYDRVTLKVLRRDPRWNRVSVWASAIAYPNERFSEATYFTRGGRFVAPSAPLRLEVGLSRGY